MYIMYSYILCIFLKNKNDYFRKKEITLILTIKLFMTAFKSKFLTVLQTTFNTFSIKNPNT